MSERPALVELLLLQREAWERGDRPSLEAFLDQHPFLLDDSDAILDLIYQEIVLREARGEVVSVQEYIQRFPRLEGPLRIQFEVEQALMFEAESQRASSTGLPRLEDCELLGELGRGAMGTVYRGWQATARRPVAVKVLAANVPAGRVRVEAVAASRLLHPNIVQLFEVKEHQGRPALVLEFVEGGSLAQKLNGKPQPPRDAARFIETLAWAMAYAHGRGVIHRDLKPANILLSAGPDEPLRRCVPKISDFGLAKFIEERERLTATNELLGTPSYMAPEQLGGSATIDARVDVYALGAVLYECLTGRPPFLGETVLDTLDQVRSQDPLPPSELQPRLPRDLEIICLKCLQKQPARRYSSARELAEDLARFQAGEPILARAVGPVERLWKWSRRRPTTAALWLICLLALSVLLVGGTLLNQALRQQRDLAREQAAELEMQLERTRRLLYTAQLLRIGTVWESDPAQALGMLEDPLVCPPDLRCLSWSLLHGQCKRYREMIASLDAAVTAMTHYPRGGLLLTGDSAGQLCFWDTVTREVASRRQAHSDKIITLALSGDGLLLASGGTDGLVRLWEMPNGTPRGQLTFKQPPLGVAWHPDGKTLLVAADQLTLWDARTLRQRRAIRPESGCASSVAISPDGALLACGDQEDAIRLWDARTGKPRGVMRGHTAPVTRLVFTRQANRLVSAGLDGVVRLWDVDRLAQLDYFEAAVGPITDLALHPVDPVVCLVGLGRGEEQVHDVQLWSLSTRSGSDPQRGHGGAAVASFAPEGKTLFTSGADRTIKFWNYPAPREQFSLRGHRGVPGSVCLSKSGRLLAWVANEVEVVVAELESGQERLSLRAQGRRVQAVALTSEGEQLAAAVGHPGEPSELLLWDTRRGRLIQAMSGHAGPVVALAFTADSQRLASLGSNGRLRVWESSSGKLLNSLEIPFSSFCDLGWQGNQLVVVGSDLLVWDPQIGEVVTRRTLTQPATCLARHPVEPLIAIGVGSEVQLHDLTSNERHQTFVTGMKEVRNIAFSEDGSTLAIAGSASGVKLWDVATGQERASLPGHRGGAVFVSFAGQRPWLLSISQVHQARIWTGAP